MARARSKADAAEEILDRLDTILRVLALQVAADRSMTESARILKMVGLDNRTIADVLNTSDAMIRTLTTNLRTRKKGKG
jgi:hypothetical protein